MYSFLCFCDQARKKNIKKSASSSQGLVTFPPVFGPYKTGLCLALCLAQVRIHTDSWSTLVQIRPNFAFLLVDRLIFFDNLVLIFCSLTSNYALRRNSPSFPPQSRIPCGESERHPLYSVCQFCQSPFNSLCLLSESTKRCLASMKDYFLDSSHVIANDSALTLRLRPEHPWVPCVPSVMRQCSGSQKQAANDREFLWYAWSISTRKSPLLHKPPGIGSQVAPSRTVSVWLS